MAALTPAEKQIALTVYQQWIPPSKEHGFGFQTDPFWQKTTPRQVVKDAFDNIRLQLYDVIARAVYRNRLADAADDDYNEYDSFPDNPIMRLLGSGDLLKLGAPQSDQNMLDREIFEILRQGVPGVIEVKSTDLLPQDPVLYEPYREGQDVIRIQGNPNWVFDGASLSEYWEKSGRNTNPLVSGFDGPVVTDDRIERGILHIVDPKPKGGRRRTRRRRTIRMKKSEYLREHHHLFKVLKNPTRRALKAELRKQQRELRERGLK